MADEGRISPFVSGFVLAALAERSVSVPPALTPRDLATPVSRAQQYALLEYADDKLPPTGVMSIGQTIATQLERVPNPLLLVLLNQAHVGGLLEEVARLNRYFHSVHRHHVEARGDGYLCLRHVSLGEDSPRPLESRFVFGLYLALLEELGCLELRGGLGEPEVAVYAGGQFRPPGPAVDAGRWHFRWDSFRPSRKPFPGLEALLLKSPPLDLAVPITTRGQVAALVRKDLSARFTIGEVAKRLAMSTRSLQRRLQGEGLSLSEVVDGCRVQSAAELLRETDLTLTEVGFACGFSDAAHFSRRFKARQGLAPSAYRARRRTP